MGTSPCEFAGAAKDRGANASSKLWEVEVDGLAAVFRFGRSGATGQTARNEVADL